MLLHIPSWGVMILPQCLHILQVDTTHQIINELHYITLNHLYLLEYNYIVVPLPSEFCECILSCERCARILHRRLAKDYHSLNDIYTHVCFQLKTFFWILFAISLIYFHYAHLIFTPCLFWVGFVFNFVHNFIHIYSLDMVWVVLNFQHCSLLLIATLCHL